MKTPTIKAFFESVGDKISTHILENLKTEEKVKIVLNLVQLKFDFEKKNVVISYYMVDKVYPDVKLSFRELKELLSKFQ